MPDLQVRFSSFGWLLLLVFVYDFELGVDNVVALILARTFLRLTLRAGSSRIWLTTGSRTGGRLLVKISANFLEPVLQLVVTAPHSVSVILLDGVTDSLDGVFNLFPLLSGNLVAQVLQLLLTLIGEGVSVVLDFNRFLRLLIFFSMGFRIALH